MRSLNSPCTPVISASAMMRAITPTPMPTIDTAEISEMKAWRRRAVRYRRATNQEKDRVSIDLSIYRSIDRLAGFVRMITFGFARAHQRKEDDIANGRA